MRTKTSLATLLIILLLADCLNCMKWQGTGSGTNQTVLAEIWANLENNLNAALTTNSQTGYNAFTK